MADVDGMRMDVLSWGRVHRYPQRIVPVSFTDEVAGAVAAGGPGHSVLGYGLGRSYGDSGLNDQQTLIDMRGLDHFVAFDAKRGEIECEAGVSLDSILRLLTSRPKEEPCWFLPVVPGTKYVTVGGAIANDVHGKSHHASGCFGSHVESLKLQRSDGQLLECSPTRNPDLFAATIGGLGLTGLIVSARIALKRVPGFWLDSEDIRYDSLDDFFEISAQSAAAYEYSVAWVDCVARGGNLGRGVFTRSRHSAVTAPGGRRPLGHGPRLALPVDLPGFMLNRLSVGAFNALYWRRAPRVPRMQMRAIDPVFFPLDAIAHWNRLYGRRGFFQYQCVVPTADARDGIKALLERVAASGQSSFLAVLKVFGARRSPGLMSFPLPGTTLALDIPNRGSTTLALLDDLDCIVQDAGGRVYPAKDGRMAGLMFRRGYPQWETLAGLVDPAFSSTFWRRVMADLPVEMTS